MRVFVTGGAGFIGSEYVRQLLSDRHRAFAGAEVSVFDKLISAGNLDNLAPVAASPRRDWWEPLKQRAEVARLERV